ncbi:MAG: metallophosphoesterase family protein [Myxococcota bacterium]
MAATTTLAHLSDIHVLDLADVGLRRYLNKRLTGLANLLARRHGGHPRPILEAAVRDLLERPVDHVLLTGDLTNLALEAEFEQARAALEPLARYEYLSVVPGNHDIYTRGAARASRFEAYFGDLMWRDGVPRPEERYPWYKRAGDIHLVGLNSAVPRLPLIASGRVADDQLGRLAWLSRDNGFHDGFTVGLVHHNLHPRGRRKDWMHGLRNRDSVLEACHGAGLDLLLHGHTHAANRFRHRAMHVVGSGSSTWDAEHPDHVARYNVYHVRGHALQHVEVRAWDSEAGRFVTRREIPADAL